MPVASVGVAAARPAVAAAAPQPPLRFAAVLEARAASAPHPPSAAPASPVRGEPVEPRPSTGSGRAGNTGRAHPAVAALSGIERAQARLEGVLAAARAGRTFTAAELIGLQSEAYRCAQAVDLAAKLVEQGAQAVKQAINTQL